MATDGTQDRRRGVLVSPTPDLGVSFLDAVRAQVTAAGYRPADPTGPAAGADPGMFRRWVHENDLFITLAGASYGARVPGDPHGRSYPVLIHDIADASHRPHLVVVITGDTPPDEAQERFRARLGTVAAAATPAEAAAVIQRFLAASPGERDDPYGRARPSRPARRGSAVWPAFGMAAGTAVVLYLALTLLTPVTPLWAFVSAAATAIVAFTGAVGVLKILGQK
jgi:hypothetical protein